MYFPHGRTLVAVLARFGHRVRWTAVWVLLAVWFIALTFDLAGGLANLLLVLAVVVLFYELLAVDRT